MLIMEKINTNQTGTTVNHGNNKHYPNTRFTGNGPVQIIKA